MSDIPESVRPLADKIALVTGASRGIGAATALEMARRGAHVLLVARTAGGLEEVEQAIHDIGGTATIAPMDVAEGDNIARLASAVAERWGRLDIMALNAAMLGTLSPVAAIDAKEFARLMTLNVSAQQMLIANFDPLLRRADAGRLIAITSSVARSPRAYWGAYAASKSALEVLVQSYGAEMASISNVRTAIIDPGATRTQMRARAFPGEDPATVKDPADVASAIADQCALDFASTAFVALGKTAG